MNKSVYSLVLMDDVVEAVDQLAYRMNTSRSNLINQILAEKLTLITPEMQMKNIFDALTMLLESYTHLQIQNQAADSMVSIKSVLKYKYNPTIRYAISLERNPNLSFGEIKLVSRTQSDLLQSYLKHFFEIWTHYEVQSNQEGWKIDQTGKWSRQLKRDENCLMDDDQVAQAIADYIRAVDKGLKLYFEWSHQLQQAQIEIAKHYEYYITHAQHKV